MTYTTRYEYECSEGHWHGANEPLTFCPCYTLGSPCSGTLTRVGAGSRGPRKAAA